MSRIWKLPIKLSETINVIIKDNLINVKWPLGELDFVYSKEIEVKQDENNIIVNPINDSSSALWWTTRAIINNMLIWVTEWYKKSLEVNGVWYKFEVQGNKLILSIWFSHKVEMQIQDWIKIALDEKLKNVLHVSWINKQLVWEIASKIRSKKIPEPYKGKWIKYLWEQVRRKAWKTWKK